MIILLRFTSIDISICRSKIPLLVMAASLKKDILTNRNEHIRKKKLLISSIPFYRNLFEYSGKESDYTKLTCFLH